jgi:hypothetical protein
MTVVCSEVYHHDDDEHDDGFRSGHDNIISHQSMMVDEVDLTEDDAFDDDENEAPSDKDACQSEHDRYKSIEDDSDEHDGDVAILDQSISLLSDDNDGVSPQQLAAVHVSSRKPMIRDLMFLN